ncbi:MAG: FecR domain-containing protein [Hungatella sp.]|nr:FecR domain-containing protein [Hungatella sp.]
MTPHKLPKRGTALLLSLSLLLSLTACGSGTKATTMYLKRAEGTVDVSDDAGADVPVLEDLGLYSGYDVYTDSDSFAWINLDNVKLTKMDQNSEIAIQKDGRDLEIQVLSGSLFFNVTDPLEDDETMNIRTSTMLVGIRGTCGWVEVPDDEHMNLYLLEGWVKCTADENVSTVSAGEMAAMTEDGEITVTQFTAEDVPGFVREEVEEDDDLAEAILEDSGIDVLAPDPMEQAMEQYRRIIGDAQSYDIYHTFRESYETVTGNYKYALVPMDESNPVPALLLSQETYITQEDITEQVGILLPQSPYYNYWTEMFQYIPDSGNVKSFDGPWEGIDFITGEARKIFMDGSGNGALGYHAAKADRGEYLTHQIVRWVIDGEYCDMITLWESQLGQFPEDVVFQELSWYDVGDLSGLDNWPSDTQPSAVTPDISDITVIGAGDTDLPTDGDRIVFTGTLGNYTYNEVLALQGVSDPNPGYSDPNETMWLIVLDTPQSMKLREHGGDEYSEQLVVSLISVWDISELEQYDGEHMIFSIDPSETYWPSDTSLPLGQPGTRDVNVLGPVGMIVMGL